jgi:hypothetical protein
MSYLVLVHLNPLYRADVVQHVSGVPSDHLLALRLVQGAVTVELMRQLCNVHWDPRLALRDAVFGSKMLHPRSFQRSL